MTINLNGPRPSNYRPDGSNPALRSFALVVPALTALGGFLAYRVKPNACRRTGGLPAPAREAVAETVEEVAP